MADQASLHVEVVSADRVVWSGESTNVVARTTEGDLGVLPGHSPLLAILVPSACEVVTTGGEREIVAVDGGFISVADGRVSILSEFASLTTGLTVADAQRLVSEAESMLEDSDPDNDDEARKMLARAQAQLKAAEKAA
ncbi:MAG TPA: F0F1 ATP synthase subunit epsilon [Candidatus Avipropionibacterium avicola]|uniref:ATP synthase epsilon chain n=1 Tax=Candidatus Avipropionibacterium avicola TaxID=2840701 RepID=A0A9D1KN60_9ACTN|nr:F0F1 ATP synthase subunit epsilon [Candidatus Avipropionibacterium avicola]